MRRYAFAPLKYAFIEDWSLSTAFDASSTAMSFLPSLNAAAALANDNCDVNQKNLDIAKNVTQKA
jgi:hypothetical protein